MNTEAKAHLKKAADMAAHCVQCGYCLPACPTYATLKTETQSPRGRIHLVRMAAEGRISLSEVSGPLDLCLGCRACEQACPSHVPYGNMLELARAAVQEQKKDASAFRRFGAALVFKHLFPRKKVMNKLGSLLWLYQRSGVKKAVHGTPARRLLSHKLALFDESLTEAKPPFRTNDGRRYPAMGRPLLKVAFFSGCMMEAVFYRINLLSIRLLQKAGCEVTVVAGQTCCGALQAHAGEEAVAKTLAKRNIEVFEAGDYDGIINNAGGCGAMLKEYDRLLADEPGWSERAARFVQKTADISVILNKLGLAPEKMLPYRVTYQPSCHLANVQMVTEEPEKLIRSIKGIEFVPLNQANVCCGSGGIYNLLHFQESMDVLEMKMADVKDTKADLIVTTNPGCLLQMKAGIIRENLNGRVRAVHLVELLAEACGIHH